MSDEHWSDRFAVCPYCEHENDPSDSDGALYEESTDEWECERCGREFLVRIFIDTSWTTEAKA